ncbi:MAG TPA: hypothetical protein VFL29_06240 [Candidatus Dormibacteraeota bacterium]|nr:hypothetical protein [Candidatus Dormibacteraeota bacterium]
MKRTVVWPAALVVGLLAALALAACGNHPIPIGHAPASPTPLPSGGISRDRAIAIALAADHTTAAHVESVQWGRFERFAPGQSTSHTTDAGTFTSTPDELVWAVTVGGNFVHPCPSCGKCEPARHQTVLIDYYNGEIMFYILTA